MFGVCADTQVDEKEFSIPDFDQFRNCIKHDLNEARNEGKRKQHESLANDHTCFSFERYSVEYQDEGNSRSIRKYGAGMQ